MRYPLTCRRSATLQTLLQRSSPSYRLLGEPQQAHLVFVEKLNGAEQLRWKPRNRSPVRTSRRDAKLLLLLEAFSAPPSREAQVKSSRRLPVRRQPTFSWTPRPRRCPAPLSRAEKVQEALLAKARVNLPLQQQHSPLRLKEQSTLTLYPPPAKSKEVCLAQSPWPRRAQLLKNLFRRERKLAPRPSRRPTIRFPIRQWVGVEQIILVPVTWSAGTAPRSEQSRLSATAAVPLLTTMAMDRVPRAKVLLRLSMLGSRPTVLQVPLIGRPPTSRGRLQANAVFPIPMTGWPFPITILGRERTTSLTSRELPTPFRV